MEVAASLQSHQDPESAGFPSPTDYDQPISQNLTRMPTSNATAPKRHTKGLSLNFPILLPTNVSAAPSPIAGVQSPLDSARSSPLSRTAPYRSPDPSIDVQDKNKVKGGGEFLTLLAAQERKVLELKEELQKAETDLWTLKKQWAAYEANKKRDEVRQVKKLQPLALDDVGVSETVATEEDADEERRRKRALMERTQTTQMASASNGGSGLVRKGSKRVFEGGRHTRTLSLLSPTTTKSGARQAEEMRAIQNHTPEANIEDNRRISLSRMATFDSLMSSDALPLGFGKTYKDLAAHRRSLPPVAADMLVKQGKQVYDGVKDGLWTFFEDIRQATVGEEGINGTAAQQRPARPNQRKAPRKSSDRPSKGGRRESTDTPKAGLKDSKEPSFWKEFGLDTPQRPSSVSSKPNGHVQQKSSTDSSNPPSLLPDLNDTDEVEDGWDAWDSPVSNKVTSHVNVEETNPGTVDGGSGLPWPEIQRVTPKLTRTISDLMKEWDSSQNDSDGGDRLREGQTHILDSPHM